MNEPPNDEDYFNRAQRAEQECAELRRDLKAAIGALSECEG